MRLFLGGNPVFRGKRQEGILAGVTAAALAASGVIFAGCGPVHDLRDFSETDLLPPVIEKIVCEDARCIRLSFNEEIVPADAAVISPSVGKLTIEKDGSDLLIKTEGGQTAGVRYTVSAAVEDRRGNRMSFLLPFYGFNPDMPDVIINEFTTQGSGKHPDLVELLVRTDGNIAGLCLIEGTAERISQQICLPAAEVGAGDYIIVHFKPQGIAEEADETGDDLGLSGGYDAAPDARDFWLKKGKGLSGNNGVLSLYAAPGGALLDAVLYSNRTSDSDEKYRGFGSSLNLERAKELQQAGGWKFEGREPRPEDAVDPDPSTSTRSICRMPAAADTDSAADWHTVPTGKASFGAPNCSDVYVK